MEAATMRRQSAGESGARFDKAQTYADAMARIESLLPEIRSRSEEFEKERRIPLDMVEKLRDAGCFRICVPAEFGGSELEIGNRLHLLSVLAEADASVGWTVAIASDTVLILIRGSHETFERIYEEDPDTVCAGAAAPTGTAQQVEGGYIVSGRWKWASGSLHAKWLTPNCVVTKDGKPVFPPGMEGGPPLWRTVVVPREQAEVIDTWDVVGLRGTGSNDFQLDNVFVPDSMTLDLFSGEPCVAVPDYRSFVAQAGLILASIAIGIARGALSDVLALAQARKQRLMASSDMSHSEIFQCRMGYAHSTLDAITTVLHAKARELVARADELPMGPAQLEHPVVLSCRAMGHWIVNQAVEIIEMAYDAGGGSSVWTSSSLQRRLRDIKTLTSHVNLSELTPIALGKGVLSGSVQIP